MLFRKIASLIEDHLKKDSKKILLIDGARQIGKTYIVRYVGQKLFPNFIEVNMVQDYQGNRSFAAVRTIEDFYFRLSEFAGDKMGDKTNTLIFLDEIQQYPDLLPLLKFLAQDGKFTFIASGSLLGVSLANSTSIPMGSIRKVRMFPLDFEEFARANGVGEYALKKMKERFANLEPLDEDVHDRMMGLFRHYLLVGGLPDAVNAYLATHNIVRVREVQSEIVEYYAADAAKYDRERKLKIARIYDLIPSYLENRKKRVTFTGIEDKPDARFATYLDEFDYLINSGIALEVKAIANPVYPLCSSATKNLLKLYLNDVGLLTNALFGSHIRPVLDDVSSVNLGSVYENVVASELIAHGFNLYYYDNRQKGEVDYLINDGENLACLPIEVKSGKDYTIHRALDRFVTNPDYPLKRAYVLSNERLVKKEGKIIYLPIYYVMFINVIPDEDEQYF